MIRIGLIGFGTVGSGVYERLLNTKVEIKKLVKQEIEISAILVKDRQKQRATKNMNAFVTTCWEEFCQTAKFDVIFEAIGGIEPAFLYTAHWLEKGVPVISANKKLVAEKGEILEQLAAEHCTYYGFEAAVAGGIPIINSLKGNLSTTSISRVSGILNGTTNYMLTEMIENHRSFAEVLLEAQELGYAEADPTDDIEGFDAWYKIRILSRLCFGTWASVTSFFRKGVSSIEDWHVEVGERLGFKVKLIAEAWRSESGISGGVTPAFLTPTEPLANVRGVMNGISLEGNAVDQLLFLGPGAGKEATANSMVEDFLFHERMENEGRATREEKRDIVGTFTHSFVFINHSERNQALEWVKQTGIVVIDTYAHHEGEGWIVLSNQTSPFAMYPIYGDVSKRKSEKSIHSAQFGAF
jgi:homoserine dehydrogenase